MSLIIEHTEAEGTVLHGTSRGDGTAELIRQLGWRWSRTFGAWFLPGSRDPIPRRDLIAATAEQLRQAGFDVTVSIDARVGDRAQAEERRAARAAARATRLTERAEREQRRADQRWEAARVITGHIPFGQPLLAETSGYSAEVARRERATRHERAALEHEGRAEQARRGAEVAAGATRRRYAPATVANRISRLEAELARGQQTLTRNDAVDHDGGPSTALQQRLAVVEAELEHWRQVRSAQIADGVATNYSRETVHAGDEVQIRGIWRRVVRANTKTVTVTTGYSWTGTVPWHEVEQHRRDTVADTRTPTEPNQ